MPKVGGKKFAYTTKGKAAAEPELVQVSAIRVDAEPCVGM
jgi:hypothetical protein